MNFKRMIVKTLVICGTALGVISTGIAANAAEINNSLNVDNFYSYTNHWSGTYSTMYAYVEHTGITAFNSNYYGAYKTAKYTTYGEQSGSYYLIYADADNGTTTTVITDVNTITNEVVRRKHVGYLHYSSNPNSSIKDSFIIMIYKH